MQRATLATVGTFFADVVTVDELVARIGDAPERTTDVPA